MITVNLIGGLGNQIFQYAFGRALALRMGYEVQFDVCDFQWYSTHEGFQLPGLGVGVRAASESDLHRLLGWRHRRWARRFRLYKRLPPRNIVVEPHFHFCGECARATDGTYLVGYWHSYKYFEDYSDQIRSDLGTAKVDLSRYGSILDDIESSDSVAIHIRRGDYVTTRKGRKVLGSCSPEYYAKAISLVRGLARNPKFFAFSDQPLEIRAQRMVTHPHVLVDVLPRPPAYAELRLMARCKHFIIANSSFSWWAAWLGSDPEKRVIAPKRWFADESRNACDLIPSDWTTIADA